MSSEQQHDQAPAPVPEHSHVSHAVSRILLLTFIFTVVGVVLGLLVPSHVMPRQMSPQGHDAVLTVIVFTVAAAPVSAIVYAIGAYSLLRWRHRGPGAPSEDGIPLRGNNLISGIWLTVSALLVVFVLTWGLTYLASDSTSHAKPLEVDVIGQQWVWSFRYPGTGVESSKLVLPVNRPVEFRVTSEDVTHGFWPQELGIQVDANPGEITNLKTTPNKLGSIYVRCSQLCGLYHAFMQSKGQVVTNQQFASWLRDKGGSPSGVERVTGLAAPATASAGGKS